MGVSDTEAKDATTEQDIAPASDTRVVPTDLIRRLIDLVDGGRKGSDEERELQALLGDEA